MGFNVWEIGLVMAVHKLVISHADEVTASKMEKAARSLDLITVA